MGRPVAERRADGSIVRAGYTDGGGLARLGVATEDGRVSETEILDGATYSVHGQRETARFCNGVTLGRAYDPQTLRVMRIRATRFAAGGRVPVLQGLMYPHDT